MPDGIYVAYKNVLSAARPGHRQASRRVQVPADRRRPEAPRWGYLNVVGDYLIGAADPLFTAELERQAEVGRAGWFKLPDADVFAASRYLVVLDRHTGKVLWTATARVGFRHNAICAGGGRLFAIDRVSGDPAVEAQGRRRGPRCRRGWSPSTWRPARNCGTTTPDMFGTWL